MTLPQEQTRQELEDEVKFYREKLYEAEHALNTFNNLPENNQFDDYDKACRIIEHKLYSKAVEDCEGYHRYGPETYSQEFIVNTVHYLGVLSVSHNRYDKTYYYVDGTDFTVNKVN